MNINERIKELGSYFKGLNIVEDTTFVLVKFPEKWKVFDETLLNQNFKVYSGTKEGVDGIFFLTETSNGVDCLFDAINYVINENKAFEEKATLLQEKANELRELFITESLEKLRTLEFTFSTKRSPKKTKNSVKREITQVVDENKTEEITTQVQNDEPVSEKNTPESDTMSFMKELTEGGKKK